MLYTLKNMTNRQPSRVMRFKSESNLLKNLDQKVHQFQVCQLKCSRVLSLSTIIIDLHVNLTNKDLYAFHPSVNKSYQMLKEAAEDI